MAATDATTKAMSSAALSAKRKRDAGEGDDEVMADADAVAPASMASSASTTPQPQSANGKDGEDSKNPAAITSSTTGNRDEKRLIRDFFEVLLSYDKLVPPILKRPLPDPAASDEPQAKRQKADATADPSLPPASSIADKVTGDAYTILDDLVSDVTALVSAELNTLKASSAKTEAGAKDDAGAANAERAREHQLARLDRFREKAYDLYRRETVYPRSGPLHGRAGRKVNGDVALSSASRGKTVLTVFGNAPQPRQLFSSLPQHTSKVPKKKTAQSSKDDDNDNNSDSSSVDGEVVRDDHELDLGGSITLTRMFPPPAAEQPSPAPTFGELFPSPRNLPPLQPPKAPKSTTKSTTLGFYHPELVEKSKYRAGSYFSQPITTGQWLDYSNATPSSPVKTRKRERAQSLAGHRPSTTELELSEMESLFRGAFSSFAPSKDDSAAIVSASQVGRMWWQRVGHRIFQRMVKASLDPEEEEGVQGQGAGVELDEAALEKTIAEWDDSLVDPSLEEAMGEKTNSDKDVDDLLQEVSDLIVTLASYQRNRNLTLPTSQDRFSADPVNADMLRNGTLAQQPSEEEMLTYETLKAQLSLIIQGLPPYAVARLNSDKLSELNISTKIEVRSEEYRGVLEEDESVLRARQAAAQAPKVAANTPRAPVHRTASVAQFNTPGRSVPMQPGGVFYPGQQPVRINAGSAGGVQQRGTGTPVSHLPPHVRGVPQGPSQYRTPNGYGNYVPPKAQQQPPVGYRAGQPMYTGSPGQPVPAHMSPQRVVSQPQPGGYGSPALQPGAQPFRYAPGSPAPPPHQQQQQQQHRLSQGAAYTPSVANNAGHLAQPQQQQHRTLQPPQGQHVGASPQQQFLHPGSTLPPGQQAIPRPSYGGGMVPQAPQVPGGGVPMGGSLGPIGYHTVMDQPQQQRLMEQARARASAHERSLGFTDKVASGGAAGNASGVDAAKLAAARASMHGGVAAAVNGQSLSPLASSVSPVPSGGFSVPP